jgi:hypothetical protein
MHDNLFIAVQPAGIVYCDKSITVDGDYACVAFLPFDTLALKEYRKRSSVLPDVRKHAESMVARRGQLFAISATARRDADGNLVGCSQTRLLGG